MTSVNKLIKENQDIIHNTEKNHSNQKRLLTEDDFYQYEGFLREKIYQQINYTLIAFETKKCTIVEKEYLIEQIPLLSHLLFDYLDGESEDYWRVTQKQSWDFFNYDYTFIQPKDFTKEKVIGLVQDLTKTKALKKSNTQKPTKTIQQYFHYLTNTDNFLLQLKSAFPIEKGISIRAIINILQNEKILNIPSRGNKAFIELLRNYFQRDIGSYQSINDSKNLDDETTAPIQKILKPLINKYKVN